MNDIAPRLRIIDVYSLFVPYPDSNGEKSATTIDFLEYLNLLIKLLLLGLGFSSLFAELFSLG